MNVWLDLGVLALIVLFGYSGYKRGLVYMALNIAGTAASLIGSALAASMLSSMLYNFFFKDRIVEAMTEVCQQVSSSEPVQAAGELLKLLSNYTLNVFSLLGIDQNGLSDMLKNATVGVPAVLEETVRPFVVRSVACILTIVLYLVLRVIIGFLIRKFSNGVNKTLLKVPNRILGTLVGIAEALLVAMLLVLILYFVMMFVSPENCASLRSSINQTICYQLLEKFNLPEMIISWIASLTTG